MKGQHTEGFGTIAVAKDMPSSIASVAERLDPEGQEAIAARMQSVPGPGGVAAGGGSTVAPTVTPLPNLPTSEAAMDHGLHENDARLGPFTIGIPSLFVLGKIDKLRERLREADYDGVDMIGFMVIALRSGDRKTLKALLANPGEFAEQAEVVLDEFPANQLPAFEADLEALLESMLGKKIDTPENASGKATGS